MTLRGWVRMPVRKPLLLGLGCPVGFGSAGAFQRCGKHPLLSQAEPATRERVVRAFLDFLRKEMAIDAKVLDAACASWMFCRVSSKRCKARV